MHNKIIILTFILAKARKKMSQKMRAIPKIARSVKQYRTCEIKLRKCCLFEINRLSLHPYIIN